MVYLIIVPKIGLKWKDPGGKMRKDKQNQIVDDSIT